MEQLEYKHVHLNNHPKNEEGVFNDLVNKYHKYGTLYIGVDFDNTLWPYMNGNYPRYELDDCVPDGFYDILQLLRRCKVLGFKLCLWSLPTSQENLNWKVEWCKSRGIEMDYVNESPLLSDLSSKYRKTHFNLLLDDVAGLESAYSILYNICEYIEWENLLKKGIETFSKINDSFEKLGNELK